MKIICDKNKCTGCAVCVSVCPQSCISIDTSKEGFFYPKIDEEKCINCKKCLLKCPSLNPIEKNKTSRFYCAWNKDLDVLKVSSSGGAFSALSEMVLEMGGIVFGAAFDSSSKTVYHCRINDSKDLDKLRLSKYYQSNTIGIYNQVKQCLDDSKYVLFSGTSCQIAGLYSFLGTKNIDSLITVDILCHGVSSKKIVDGYIKSKEKFYGKTIVNYKFRCKDVYGGWKNSTRMNLFFDDGSSTVESNDTFFMGFNNIILRDSCYHCRYSGINRISDFTIADFWGVTEKRVSIENLKRGVSLILFNSNKANTFMNFLLSYMEISEVLPEEAIPFNLALIQPNEMPKERVKFFKLFLRTQDYDFSIRHTLWKIGLKIKIKKILGEKNTQYLIRLKKMLMCRNGK